MALFGKRIITAVMAVVLFAGFAPSRGLFAAEKTKELKVPAEAATSTSVSTISPKLELTAILLGPQGDDYKKFVDLMDRAGVKVKLVKQLDFDYTKYSQNISSIGVVKESALVMEKAGVMPKGYTDLVLVTWEGYEGTTISPLRWSLSAIKSSVGVDYPARLTPVRNTEFVGINSTQAGYHGLMGHTIESLRTFGFARFAGIGTCHTLGLTELRQFYGQKLLLGDGRFSAWQQTEDSVQGFYPAVLYDVFWWHELWYANTLEDLYGSVSSLVRWLKTDPSQSGVFESARLPEPTAAWQQRKAQQLDALGWLPASLKGVDTSRALTRQGLAALLVTSYEKERGEIKTLAPAFADCKSVEVRKAVRAGLMSGTGSKNFSPGATVTRQDCAVAINALLGKLGIRSQQELKTMIYDWDKEEWVPGYETVFDEDQVAAWAKDAVRMMEYTGLMPEPGGGSYYFKPTLQVTVGQAEATLYRVWYALQQQ